ncbi:Signal transduction histidine kinase [Algoriphagus faecimaris]|uniref:Oxygen sensor histidine kinase NreB n=1 Tax=Algoriphagus faecimaris TaxID=686796 RepID=A0A1G6WJL0_9BACT|nr:tetratricopeptide repeat protein [Algoriphagus faecimaris]SDD66062.1 Signal transduction histidine kinase [Algoriphagus faecimaris]
MKRQTFILGGLSWMIVLAATVSSFSQQVQKADLDLVLREIGLLSETEDKQIQYRKIIQKIMKEPSEHQIELLRYGLRMDTTLLGKKQFNAFLAQRLYEEGSFLRFVGINEDLIWDYIDRGDEGALLVADQLMDLSEEYSSSLGKAKALQGKGLFHEIVKGDVETASRFYFEAIAVAEYADLDYLADLHHNVGVMFHESDNYEKAIHYYQLAYEQALEQTNPVLQKKCLINMASVNSSMNEYEKAEALFFKSLDIKLDSTISYNYDYDTYANLGNLYLRQSKYPQAIEYLSKSTEQVPQNPNSEANLRFLIDAKLQANDTVGLGNLVQRLNETLTVTSSAREKSLLTKTIADYYEKIGAYDQAYEYLKDYISLYAGIIENKKDETFLELEAKYQNEQLSALIEKRRKQRQLLILGIIASLTVTAILYLFYRNRLKYQKLLAKQHEELQMKKITELTQKNKLVAMTSMLEGQEAERLRIAKDLHDSLGGLLSNIKAHFTIIENEIVPLDQKDTAERTHSLIDIACLEVRRISHNMMPHALSISGLEGALDDLAGHMRTLKYDVTLEVHQLPERLDNTKEITLFRLIQELLSNIRKHASATSVFMQLFGHGKGLQLVVEDNGKGFDFEQAIASGGLGLKSIQSRVEFLDGTIAWDSVPNQGTTVTINIPV